MNTINRHPHHRLRVTLAASMLAMGASLIGCSDPPPPKEPTQPVAPPTAAMEESTPSKAPTAGNIQLGPKLAKLCEMPTAYFAFDSANLSDEAKSALDVLAKCFTEGNAKNERMSMVGHADPRGETEYNFGLGQRRAGSVEELLKSRGVGAERIESSSRGELDATGTDEETWAKDRRVDIELMD